MIYKTIGIGGDYSDINSFINALAVSGMSDNTSGVVISDISNTTAPSYAPISFNGYTLNITSDINHYGNPNAGRLITHSASNIIAISASRSANLDISNLKIFSTTGSTNLLIGASIYISAGYSGIPGGTYSFNLENLIINNNHRQFEGGGIRFQAYPGYTGTAIVKNCKFYHVGSALNPYGFIFIFPNTYYTPSNIVAENISCYSCQVGFEYSQLTAGNSATLRNVVACGSHTSDFVKTSMSGYSNYNNADSDGSAPAHTGVQHNIIQTNEFQSLDPTNEKFLFLKQTGSKYISVYPDKQKGKSPLRVKFTPEVKFDYGDPGVLGYSGTAPTYATTDIEGNERPGEDGLYSIGCHEFQFDWQID